MKTDELRNTICAIPFVASVYYDETATVRDSNVGIFVHTLEQGGSQRAIESLIDRLIRRKYGVFILSPVGGEYATVYAEKYGACVFVTDDRVDLSADDRDKLRLFDIVFINSFCSFRYSLYYINTNTPCIYWIHEGVEITGDNIENIDRIIVGSRNCLYAFPWLKPLSMWKEAFPQVKTAFLPIEVKDVSKEAVKKKTGKTRFLIPGSYNPHKGFHVAVQAFVLMEASGYTDYEAVFCGYDDKGEYYETISEACSRYSNISIIGELGQKELYEQMSEADCVIVPSLFDAGPLTAVEALMHEKALIVSDSCGISQFIEDSTSYSLI